MFPMIALHKPTLGGELLFTVLTITHKKNYVNDRSTTYFYGRLTRHDFFIVFLFVSFLLQISLQFYIFASFHV
jgi:hypothetical protein